MERALLEKESLKKDMAETEGARRASGVSASGGVPEPPDPEVAEKPKRRRFSAEYRLRIVREADSCTEPGEIGALLRREGLYSSLLTAWRRQRDAGALAGLEPKKRGPKSKAVDPRVKRLEREVSRLKRKLEQAETIIDIQKNVRAPRRLLLDQKLPSTYLLRRPREVAVSLLVPSSP
jgi:transposase-like protein